jgi:hypothetical protein
MGCAPMAARRYATRGFQEWQKAKSQDLRRSQDLPELFRRPSGLRQRVYHTSANSESLQGIEDRRGPVGMTAMRKRGLRCSRPPLGGIKEAGRSLRNREMNESCT